MASKAPLGPFILDVKFEPRGDGGLRVSCDRVPGFHLSGSDADAVLADVEPALTAILSELFGHPMRVERAWEEEEPVARLTQGQRARYSYVGQRLPA